MWFYGSTMVSWKWLALGQKFYTGLPGARFVAAYPYINKGVNGSHFDFETRV